MPLRQAIILLHIHKHDRLMEHISDNNLRLGAYQSLLESMTAKPHNNVLELDDFGLLQTDWKTDGQYRTP